MSRLHLLRFISLSILACTPVLRAASFPHGLLFSGEDIPRIQENTRHPALRAFWESMLSADVHADRNFLREAFIHVLTGEEERAVNARRYALERVREEKWHRFQDADGTPIGFLRTAAKTREVALVYDWLYDRFTEAEREEIRTALAEKGCQPIYNGLYGFKYPESVKGWGFTPDDEFVGRVTDMSRWPEILSRNNFRAVMNGGLALGLYVLKGHDPRAEEWETLLLESIPAFNAVFKDDGSYDEAVAYVNYAMKFQIHAMEAVRRQRGIDFFDTANFTGLTDFVLAMYMPSESDRHGSVTFGDAAGSLQSNTAFWIASKARDGLSQYLGLHLAEHYWTSFIYLDPSVRPAPPDESTHHVETDLDWIIARTGYEVDDLVLAMRSGGPMNHEHADRNAILFKAFGEILLADHGKVTYDPRSPQWVLRTALGHNMILIDGKGIDYHQGEEGTNESDSSAKIVRAGQRPGYIFWASDATPAYRLVTPDVEAVTRSVLLFPEAPCLVVMDKVVMSGDAAQIAARWHLENRDGAGDIQVKDGSGFTFHRPTARLHVESFGSGAYSVAEGTFDFAEAGQDFRYVDVTRTEPAKESLLITVATPLRPDDPDPVMAVKREGSLQQIEISLEGSVIRLDILNDGPLPEFEILRNDTLH